MVGTAGAVMLRQACIPRNGWAAESPGRSPAACASCSRGDASPHPRRPARPASRSCRRRGSFSSSTIAPLYHSFRSTSCTRSNPDRSSARRVSSRVSIRKVQAHEVEPFPGVGRIRLFPAAEPVAADEHPARREGAQDIGITRRLVRDVNDGVLAEHHVEGAVVERQGSGLDKLEANPFFKSGRGRPLARVLDEVRLDVHAENAPRSVRLDQGDGGGTQSAPRSPGRAGHGRPHPAASRRLPPRPRERGIRPPTSTAARRSRSRCTGTCVPAPTCASFLLATQSAASSYASGGGQAQARWRSP